MTKQQICVVIVEVKEMYKRQIWLELLFILSATLSTPLLPQRLTAIMNKIALFFAITITSLGLTKRNKLVLPACVPATSLETSDKACPSNSLLDKEAQKTKTMLGAETWFRPCDCGGPGWEKITFYDFSQQECPPDFARLYGKYNNVSCQCNDDNKYNECKTIFKYYSSSLSLPVKGRSYSSVCGRVTGHGWGRAFISFIECNYSIEQPYVYGVSLTHGPAGRRRHVWTFAAAVANGDILASFTRFHCACSNTNMNWTHTTPDDVGHDYFCDSFRHREDSYFEDLDEDDLWDGEGCGSSNSCCKWNDPPYFCKHLHYTTSEDMEIRLFSDFATISNHYHSYSSVSLIEIYVR